MPQIRARVAVVSAADTPPMAVPLLAPVLEILNLRYEERRSDEYVFPAKRDNAATKHLTEPKKAWGAICKSAKLENVHIHDLRRTLGSWQALLGTSLQIIGRSLGTSRCRARRFTRI